MFGINFLIHSLPIYGGNLDKMKITVGVRIFRVIPNMYNYNHIEE